MRRRGPLARTGGAPVCSAERRPIDVMTTSCPLGAPMKPSLLVRSATGRLAVVALVLYVAIGLGADMRVLFHSKGFVGVPFFTLAPGFLAEHASRPGGMAAYAAAFLVQTYVHPWVGGFLVVALSTLLAWQTDAYLRAVLGRRLAGVRYVPFGLSLLMLHLGMEPTATMVALTCAVAPAAAYAGIARPSAGAFAIAVPVVAPVVYYLGGGSLLVLLALLVVCEIRRGRRLRAMAALVAAEIIPYIVGVSLLGLPMGPAFLANTPLALTFGQRWLVTNVPVALSACVPLLALAAFVLPFGSRPDALEPEPVPHAKRKSGAPREPKRRPRPWAGASAKLVVPLAIAAFTGLWCRSLPHLVTARMGDAAARGDWNRVIALGRAPALRGTPNAYASHQVNRALFEEGRLLDEMFRYPQGPQGLSAGLGGIGLEYGFVPNALYDTKLMWFFSLGDVDLRVGLVSDAEHIAHEVLETYGEHPEVLKRLAEVYALRGRDNAAEVWLNALEMQPYHRGEARAMRQALHEGTLLQGEDLALARSRMVRRPLPDWGSSAERRLRALLDANPGNRMALEYLAAADLLVGRLEEVPQLLPRFAALGYPRLPRHLEEAIVLLESATGQRVDLCGFTVASEVRFDYLKFRDGLRRLGPNPSAEATRDALGWHYGCTYWYYAETAESGVGEA